MAEVSAGLWGKKLVLAMVQVGICYVERSPFLVEIIKTSLRESTLEYTVVWPVLKKLVLDISDLVNFCLVSNLSFLSKVKEKVVVDRLQQHLNSEDVLDSSSLAWNRNSVGRIARQIPMAENQGGTVMLILLAFLSAFDTINYEQVTHLHVLARGEEG